MEQDDTVQVGPEFSLNISQHALTAVSDDDDVGAGGLTLKGVRGTEYFSSYRWVGGWGRYLQPGELLLCWGWCV